MLKFKKQVKFLIVEKKSIYPMKKGYFYSLFRPKYLIRFVMHKAQNNGNAFVA